MFKTQGRVLLIYPAFGLFIQENLEPAILPIFGQKFIIFSRINLSNLRKRGTWTAADIEIPS
jgi:hypothetical protein